MPECGLNYESEFSNALLQALVARYGAVDEARAFEVLLLRAVAATGKAPNTLWPDPLQMGLFLAQDLHLPLASGSIPYQDSALSLTHGQANSLANIWDEWLFRFGKASVALPGGEVARLAELATRHAMIAAKVRRRIGLPRKDPRFAHQFLHAYLIFLTETYGLKPQPPGRIPGVIYSASFNDFQPTLEERAARLVADDGQRSPLPRALSEQALETYLAHHLDLIEAGLTLVGRQVLIPDGRLDILARDQMGRPVIIELKVEVDTDLLWQSQHYPKVYRELGTCAPPRMIVIAPPLPRFLMDPLLASGGVELFSYHVSLRNGRIKRLILSPIGAERLAEGS